MPYVPAARRTPLELTRHAESAGELNYLITLDMLDHLERHGLSYDTLNEIVGAVTLAREEFVRRIVDDYEDGKIEVNGDLAQYTYWREHMSHVD